MESPLQAGIPDNTPAPQPQPSPAPAAPRRATSLDRAQLAAWRFQETNGFVVKDYTGIADGEEPVIMVVKSSDIFEVIADATQNQKQITVFAIGPCVIDLS